MSIFTTLLLFAELGISTIEIVEVPVIFEREHESKTYREVASRLSPNDYRYVQYDQNRRPVDDITVVHEGLHMLNASISTAGWHGFYLGEGKGIKIEIPKKTKISDIEIPKDQRTSRYQLYVINARRWWNHDITYLADEALAYMAGAKVREELGWDKRAETIRNGKELTEFFRAAVNVVKKKEPDYDAAGLDLLLQYLDSYWDGDKKASVTQLVE